MEFSNLALWTASVCAGIWNILNEKYETVRRSVCAFMLGFGFCYTPALIMSHFGYDSETATCVGYICGVVSTKIYDTIIKCLNRIPDILSSRLGEKHYDSDE